MKLKAKIGRFLVRRWEKHQDRTLRLNTNNIKVMDDYLCYGIDGKVFQDMYEKVWVTPRYRDINNERGWEIYKGIWYLSPYPILKKIWTLLTRP